MFPTEIEGFGGGTSQEDIDSLNKALSSGYAQTTSMTGGASLRIESLEATLKIQSFKDKHCVLFKNIAKNPAFSTVEEYTQLQEYGSSNGSFVGEGVLPESDDSTYARKASLVKFLGTTRQVTHQMTLVKTIVGDAIAREAANGTLKLMRDIENGLFWGNSALTYNNPTIEGVEWDGLNKLISGDDLDLGNTNPEESTISDVAQIIADNYGDATDVFCSFTVGKILSQSMLPKERIAVTSAGGAITAGQIIDKVQTDHGTLKINPDIFLGSKTGSRSPKVTPPAAATSAKAPVAPTSIADTTMTGTTGKFRASQAGAAIKAVCTACNRYGESVVTAASTGVTVVASTDLAKLIPYTIVGAAAVGANLPEWYNIYVTEPGGTTYYLVAQVAAASQANSGSTTYNYDGYIMPNTSIMFVGQMTPEVLVLKQLAPLMKMDLAIVDPSFRFMILYYAVPQLFMPKFWSRVVNVKDK